MPRARTPSPASTSASHSPSLRWVDLFSLATLVVAAWGLYRPGERRAFDYVDFPELFTMLQSKVGATEQITALVSYYWTHGRFNPVAFAAIVMKWETFGLWSPGWQCARFLAMTAVVALTWRLLRELGATRFGAWVGAALFVVSPPGARGWLRLTAAEPLGTLFLLLAAWLAIAGHRLPGRRSRLVLLALSVSLALLTKEMLLAALILPLLLARSSRDDASSEVPGIAAMAKRWDAWIAMALGVAFALAPIAVAYLTAPPTAYAARFGSAGFLPVSIIGAFATALLPFAPVGSTVPALSISLLTLWLAIVCAGWMAPAPRAMHPRAPWVAVLLPLAGALAYAPWPAYVTPYAIPFLFGGSVLLAGAVSRLESKGGWWRHAARVSSLVTLAFALAGTFNDAQWRRAVQDGFGQAPRAVTALVQPSDSVLVAVPQTVLDAHEPFSWRLQLMSGVLGRPWPATRDASCEELDRASRSGASYVTVRFSSWCPTSSGTRQGIVERYLAWDWESFSIRRDSVRIDVAVARASIPKR